MAARTSTRVARDPIVLMVFPFVNEGCFHPSPGQYQEQFSSVLRLCIGLVTLLRRFRIES